MNRFYCNLYRSFALGVLPALALLALEVSQGQAQLRLKNAPLPSQIVTQKPTAVPRTHPLDLALTAKMQPDGTVLLRGSIKYSPIVLDTKSEPGKKSEFGTYSLYQRTEKDWALIFKGNFMVDPYETVQVISRGIKGSTRFKMSAVLKINGHDHSREVEATLQYK